MFLIVQQCHTLKEWKAKYNKISDAENLPNEVGMFIPASCVALLFKLCSGSCVSDGRSHSGIQFTTDKTL